MSRKVIFEFDPFELAGVEPPKNRARRQEILETVRDYVLETTLEHVADENSPVAGHGRFKKLSKAYKVHKELSGHPGDPNLLFDGDMLDAYGGKIRGTTIEVGISGPEGDKADGHNNHSGQSELPTRRFVPAEGETYKKPILDGIKRIVRLAEDDE